jgi:hypothetical protein
MRANAPAQELTTSPSSNEATIEDAAKIATEFITKARRELEDRFRQAFAERVRHDNGAQQCGGFASAKAADRRKQ